MPNLFSLYQQYLTTKDKALLGEIAASKYTYSVIYKARNANTDYKRQQRYLEPEELISLLYIRLDKHLLDKYFSTEGELKQYIKLSINGFIKTAATRNYFNNRTIVTSTLSDYDTATTDDLGLVHYTEAEAYIKQYPYLYDYCFLDKSIREIMKEQKLGYKSIKEKIDHLESLLY